MLNARPFFPKLSYGQWPSFCTVNCYDYAIVDVFSLLLVGERAEILG